MLSPYSRNLRNSFLQILCTSRPGGLLVSLEVSRISTNVPIRETIEIMYVMCIITKLNHLPPYRRPSWRHFYERAHLSLHSVDLKINSTTNEMLWQLVVFSGLLSRIFLICANWKIMGRTIPIWDRRLIVVMWTTTSTWPWVTLFNLWVDGKKDLLHV